MQNYVIYDNAIVKPVSEIPAEIVKKKLSTGHFKYVHSCNFNIVTQNKQCTFSCSIYISTFWRVVG